MALLQEANVVFYHPLDNTTEYLQSHAWDNLSNTLFSGGIIVSGITRSSTGSAMSIEEELAAGGYSDIDGSTSITMCFWASGFYGSNSFFKTVHVGFEDATSLKNVLRIQKTNINTVNAQLRLQGSTIATPVISTKPSDNDWHFVVLDATKEGTDWRLRVSFDGATWEDLGASTFNNTPNTNLRALINYTDTSSDRFIIDEVVFWKDATLFTDEELSNLYELANTHNRPMNEYTEQFPPTVSGDMDLFIHGFTNFSGSLDLYIPGQLETDNLNLFIHGSTIFSGSMDLYTEAAVLFSGSLDLSLPETFAISSGNLDLYLHNTFFNNDINLFLFNHQATGDMTLFIYGKQVNDIDVFVKVVDNDINEDLNLFINGIGSGFVDPVFFFNNELNLFIKDSGDNKTYNREFLSFVKVVSGIEDKTIDFNVFVRGGNTNNSNLQLYIKGHPSGSNPFGIEISNSINLFTIGDGELINEDFIPLLENFNVFVRVQSGVLFNVDLFISGIQFPSGSIDLYTFGIIDIENNSLDLFINGNTEPFDDNINLYIFGIKDVSSGNIDLFLNSPDIGLENSQLNNYIHGF